MFDLGLTLTAQAIRRQLAAKPCELYLVRLIHNATKRPFPGERLWTATRQSRFKSVIRGTFGRSQLSFVWRLCHVT